MSKEALAKVVQRAISDAGFRRQLNSDPAGALRGFDLSADELSALRTGNAGRLSTLGVDQRMSKAFAIGGVAAATRMAQSDLSSGDATMIDDASGLGSRTVIPADPMTSNSADASGGAAGPSSVRVGDDYKFAGRQSPEGTNTVRTGDDWKFADRASQASAAPVEGSPEASAADIAASGGSSARSINDDPDGFLAANANADMSGSVTRSVNDDPDGFLAANANADMSGSVTRSVNDDPDGFLAANANADVSGGTRGDGTAFLDDSEAYLTKVGYDASAASPNAKATWSGDENAGPASVADDDGGASPNATEDGPNINP